MARYQVLSSRTHRRPLFSRERRREDAPAQTWDDEFLHPQGYLMSLSSLMVQSRIPVLVPSNLLSYATSMILGVGHCSSRCPFGMRRSWNIVWDAPESTSAEIPGSVAVKILLLRLPRLAVYMNLPSNAPSSYVKSIFAFSVLLGVSTTHGVAADVPDGIDNNAQLQR